MVAHERGLYKLMLECGPTRYMSDFNRGIFYSTYKHDVNFSVMPMPSYDGKHVGNAILHARVSDFDTPVLTSILLPDPLGDKFDLKSTSRIVMQQMIRIPQLIVLVRTFRQDPNDIAIEVEAVQLAELLYTPSLDLWVSRIMTDGV